MKVWNHQNADYENPIGPHWSQDSGVKPIDLGNVAYACIIDGDVVETSVANKNYIEILTSNFKVVDITEEYNDFDSDSGYVLKFIVDEEEKLIVGVKKRYGAIMLSNPIIVLLNDREKHSKVEIGWKYEDNNFYCPIDFDPYSDDLI